MPTALRITGSALVLVLLLGGSFLAGRWTAPDRESTESGCQDARATVTQALGAAQDARAVTPDAGQSEARTAAHAILQNETCFDAQMRATAQSFLDTQDQQQMDQLKDDVRQCVEDATDSYSWSNC